MKTVHTDCRHFKGNKPCTPHLESNAQCETCSEYDPVKFRIVIIKFGPEQEVIQTTSLLRALKRKHPDAKISWLTQSPESLSEKWVDDILSIGTESIEWLKANTFDLLINIDTNPLAISLAEKIEAGQKYGFGMDKFGRCRPLDDNAAMHKWQILLWNDIKTINRMHYVEEIFLMCGLHFNGEEPIAVDESDATNLNE